MSKLASLLNKNRERLGYTQSELARLAGVSLATLQNLESGRSVNPSWDTLRAILGVLRIGFYPRTLRADWNALAACGAPLMSVMTESGAKPIEPTPQLLIASLRSACAELDASEKRDTREQRAVEALLLALATHFPSYFRRHCRSSPLVMKFYPERPLGQSIKLKRQAVAALARYL